MRAVVVKRTDFRYNVVSMMQIGPQTHIVAVDLETTGLIASSHRVVEFAAVSWQQGRETGHFQTLVHPGCPIPPGVTRVHGITDAMVRDQPRAADVLPAFLAFCDADVIVAHNAPFDMRFLEMECLRAGLAPLHKPIIDTCALARQRLPGSPNYRLETLKSVLGLGHGQAHRALDDARDCLAILLACLQQPLPTLQLPVKPQQPLEPEHAPLQQALEDGGSLFIEYQDTRGRVTSREIRPLMLCLQGGVQVLEAHCLLRGEQRHFSLDRILRMWR